MQRAAVSVMSNLAEGYVRRRPTEFHQFTSIAKASCAEVRLQLHVALDAGDLQPDEFTALMALAEEVGRLTGGLRASLARKLGSKA